MPGYPIYIAIFKDSNTLSRFRCPKCDLLLNDPVQPACGHRMCKSCADEILAEDTSPLCPHADCREPFDNEDGAYVSYLVLLEPY